MDESIRVRLEQAEVDLISASTAFREMKNLVKRGERTDEDLWPLMEVRKTAYAHWRSIADPLVADGIPLSPEVLKVLHEHRG